MESHDLFAELAALTALDGPSGFEEPVLAYARDQLEKACDEVRMDVRGNLYGYLAGRHANQAGCVMVMTHADEIGLQTTLIEPDGFLRFTKIGGISDAALPGSRVRVLTRTGPVNGLIGLRPGHLAQPGDPRTIPPLGSMYVDVGVRSMAEAAELGIEPGTPIVLYGPLAKSARPRRVFGKAIDNRAGLCAQLRVARRAKEERIAADLVMVVTVEEEVGLRGAQVAARRRFPGSAGEAPPDVVIAVDTVPAGGAPDVSPRELPWEIGRGPLLKVRETKGFLSHPRLREHFRRAAAETSIPYQLIVDTAGITDATAAQQADGAIAALTIGLPRGYSHSAVELLDLDDLENAEKLLYEGLARIVDHRQWRRLEEN